MNKKIFLIVSVLAIVGGTVAGFFTVNDTAQVTSFAVTMFGAGLACAGIWENRKKEAKSSIVIASMALVGIGAFLAGLTKAVTETQMTTIIGLVLSLLLVIVGIIASGVFAKKE